MLSLILHLVSAQLAGEGLCVGQAWVSLRPGQTGTAINEAGYEAAIVAEGERRWSIITQPEGFRYRGRKERLGGRPGATLYRVENGSLLAETATGNYLLATNSADAGWRDFAERIDFAESGRASCRENAGL